MSFHHAISVFDENSIGYLITNDFHQILILCDESSQLEIRDLWSSVRLSKRKCVKKTQRHRYRIFDFSRSHPNCFQRTKSSLQKRPKTQKEKCNLIKEPENHLRYTPSLIPQRNVPVRYQITPASESEDKTFQPSHDETKESILFCLTYAKGKR